VPEERARVRVDDQFPDFGGGRFAVFADVAQEIVQQFVAGDLLGFAVEVAVQFFRKQLVAEALGLVEPFGAGGDLMRFAVLKILEVENVAAFEERAVAVSPGHDDPSSGNH